MRNLQHAYQCHSQSLHSPLHNEKEAVSIISTGKSSSGCQHAVTKIRQQFSNLSAAVLLQLSPALRNRFTEIWCPPSNARADLIQIIEHNIKPGVVLKSASHGMTLLIIQ